MTISTYERANKGAEILDSKCPGWHNMVNLETLDVSDVELCVLGQLYGSYENGVNTINVYNEYRCGFNIAVVVPETHLFDREMRNAFVKRVYAPLTQTWRELILARRHMDDMIVLTSIQGVAA